MDRQYLSCFGLTAYRHWISRNVVLLDVENDLEHLELNSLDRQFFSRSVQYEALGCGFWCEIIAVDDTDFNFYLSTDYRKSRLVADVVKDVLALAGGTLVEEDVDVEIWRYRYFVNRP